MLRTFAAVAALLALALNPALAAPRRAVVVSSGAIRPLPAGDTVLTNPATTANASINLPHGTAPAAPVNGDCWTTTAGVFCRINGVTVDLGAGGGGGSGTVTSIALSGGSTGLTASGSPVTGAGTLTLGGTLALASGGTGAATASAARTALGVALGSDVQAYDADLAAIAALSTTSAGRGLLDDADAAAQRSTLGLGTLATQSGTFSGTSSGTNTGDQDLSSYATTAAVASSLSSYATTSAVAGGYQPLDADLTSIAALSTTAAGRALLDDADASAQRTTLGLGTLATQSGTFSGTSSGTNTGDQASIVGITGSLAEFNAALTGADFATGGGTATGSNTGDQDLSGYATTAAVTAGYQPLDADLTSIAALTTTAAGRALLDDADVAAQRSTLGLAIGTNVQAYDADLTTYAGITPSADVQTQLGAASFAAMRSNLALVVGTNVQAYDADLTTYAGITPSADVQTQLAAASFAAMRSNLALVVGTNVQAYDADLTTWAGVTPGTGVATALAVNTGSAGAFVTLGGALGTPSSGTLTNATGLPVAGIAGSTSTALGVGSLELGAASDTTLARSGAGDATIEGNALYRAGGTDVPLTDGGTGASTAAAGLANLGGAPLASPVFTGTMYWQQGAPVARNSTTTLTIADVLTGLITTTSASAVSLTLPTGTLSDAGILSGALAADRMFDWYTINLGSSTGAITLVAGTGHTIVGSVTCAISTTCHWGTRKTAANTFVTYRL